MKKRKTNFDTGGFAVRLARISVALPLAGLFAAGIAVERKRPVEFQQAPPASAVTPLEETQTLGPGVVYRHLRRAAPAGEPWSIHVLEVSRREKRIAIRAVHSQPDENGMQRELPTAMAARASAAGSQVLAVVNGDYDLNGEYLGVSDGLTITSGEISTTGKPKWPAMAVLKSGEPVIGVPEVEFELRAGKRAWFASGLNKPMGAAYGSGPFLFTSDFRSRVKMGGPFRAAMINQLQPALPLQTDSEIRGVVAQRVDGAAELVVPAGAIATAERATPSNRAVSHLPVGSNVKLRIAVRMNGKKGVREAIGGFPILVRDARLSIEGQPGEYLQRRHPRTAVCYNDHSIIFTVVDGRQPQWSAGMTLEELAALEISLGCTMALNTDGGGSSVMAISDSALHIVNSPSDGQERGRGNAWLVVRKKR